MCMTPFPVLKEQPYLGDVLWGSEVHGLSTVGGTCPAVGQWLLLCSLVGRAGT